MSRPDTVYVVGGSNCLMTNGWVAQWSEIAPELAVTNLAVGGSTSLMATYRLLSGEIPDGATVIWEYSLNEQTHWAVGQSLESLMDNLAWFLELAARRDIRVLPLIFWNQPELRADARRGYRDAMFALIEARGLHAVDMRPVLDEFASKRGRMPGFFYSDPQHYKLGTGFPRRIATAVNNRLGQARVPVSDPCFDGSTLHLLRPDRAPDERFENRVIKADLYAVDEETTIRADGKVICAYVIASEGGQPMTMRTDGRKAGHFSMQFPAEGRALKRLMKHVVLLGGRREDAAAAQEFSVRRKRGWGRVVAQTSFARHDAGKTGEREALIGILVER
ncbi:hypothetical protein [Paracoccus zeaxanthinifaciens]|uniref:hypothetical protein n=1 Tax=Paracoccus zeaxanthinifaciens TaxID=187400 RepID=UPI000416073E|nr:hypothetical protein [Paracoccus zeaxanthinifaciens]